MTQTAPGSDPNYPPYGRGTGASPLAVGEDAFETKPIDPIDVRTQSEPRFSRRELKTTRQEFGYSIPSTVEYSPEPTAMRPQDDYPETSPMPAGDPSGNYGVMPPDDANRAGATVRQ